MTDMVVDRPRRSLIALDVTRFACAAYVVVFHFGGFVPAIVTGVSAASGPVRAGWIGVELFFVLSGVVIAWSAEGSRPLAFVRRRALRLLPAAWLCASITAAAMLVDATLSTDAILRRWLTSVAFVPVGTPIDSSYWTLAIEVHFYVAVALMLRGGATAERIEGLAIGLGWASAIYWAATLIGDVLPMQNRFTQLTLLPHGCFFALGVLIRMHQCRGHTPARTALMLVFVAAGLVEMLDHAREVGQGDAPGWAIGAFAIGLAPILLADQMQPWLERHVPARTAVTFGMMTYPLYLLHQQLGWTVTEALDAAGWSRGTALAAAALVAVGLAWIVARYGEPATRDLLAGVLSRRRAPAPDSRSTAFP